MWAQMGKSFHDHWRPSKNILLSSSLSTQNFWTTILIFYKINVFRFYLWSIQIDFYVWIVRLFCVLAYLFKRMFSKAIPVVTKTGFCPFTFEGGTYALPSFIGGQFYLNIVAIMNSLQNTGVLMPLCFISVIWSTYIFSRCILIMQWFLKKTVK